MDQMKFSYTTEIRNRPEPPPTILLKIPWKKEFFKKKVQSKVIILAYETSSKLSGSRKAVVEFPVGFLSHCILIYFNLSYFCFTPYVPRESQRDLTKLIITPVNIDIIYLSDTKSRIELRTHILINLKSSL